MKTRLAVVLVMISGIALADAQSKLLVDAIPDLPNQIKAAQKKVDIPVVLPSEVPTSDIHFIYFDASDRDNYHITLSNDKNCQGEKQCSIATIIGEKGALPSIFYNMTYEELTQRVQLTPDISGYYTPSFAIGSTSPSQISFRCENVMYTVSWHMPVKQNLKESLIALAKSMIANQATCDYHR